MTERHKIVADVQIPQGDPNALTNLLRRERAAKKASLSGNLSPDVMAEVEQCDANLDALLDHFPGGVHRDLARAAVIAIDNERRAA